MASELRVNNIKNRSGLGTVTFADEGLVISGITSFSLGDTSLIVGSGTSTGTADQKLQVTGGAYVSGAIGIGTTNPSNTLTINQDGTVPILGLRSGNDNKTIDNDAQIAFGWNGTDNYQHFIHTRHNSVNSDNAIDFYVCDGTQNNTVTSGSVHNMTLVSGNVGIGTTAPVSNLHVYGESRFYGSVAIGTDSTPNADYTLTILSPSALSGGGVGERGILVDLDGWINNTTEYGMIVDVDSTATDDITANRTQYAFSTQLDTYVPENATTTTGTRFSLYGYYNNVVSNDNPDSGYTAGVTYQQFGTYNRVRMDAAGGCNDARGTYNLVQAGPNAAATANTITNAVGSYNTILNSSANTTFTNAFGSYNWINQDVAGGTTTTATGCYSLLDHDAGTAGTGYLFRGAFAGTWSTKYGLYFSGDTSSFMTGTLTQGSDISLKSNVKTIENAVDKIKQLRGVEYDRIDMEGNPHHIGVIAQEVESVFPEVVFENEEGIKAVAYQNLVSVLIQGIKEQQETIENLQSRIIQLETAAGISTT